MEFLIGFGIVALIVLSLFIILVVLMQRPSANAGMGSALGGGAAEQAFGSETGNVLTKATVWATILFFVLCFGLFLGTQKKISTEEGAVDRLTPIEDAAPEPPAPPAPSAPAATSGTGSVRIVPSTSPAASPTGGIIPGAPASPSGGN